MGQMACPQHQKIEKNKKKTQKNDPASIAESTPVLRMSLFCLIDLATFFW